MDIQINAVSEDVPRNRSENKAPADLRAACQQFEGLLVGMILKESLRVSFSEPDEDTATGLDGFRDFCIEQVASSLAETSSLGIADQLLEQVDVRVKREGI